ncbi:MAG: hypothetical protein AVO38_11975 [delta proteobacterium ML8_D]|nr:MAG: hypothetical protein AVO38_11975 [delta proteobacterium ML8_D]
MAHLVETPGQDVLEEAPHELGRGESHSTPSMLLRVFVAEGNVAVLEGENTVIGDRDAVDIAGKIRKHLISTLHGWFTVDNPVGLPEGLRKSTSGSAFLARDMNLARKILDRATTGTR